MSGTGEKIPLLTRSVLLPVHRGRHLAITQQADIAVNEIELNSDKGHNMYISILTTL